MHEVTKDVSSCGTGCHIGGVPACILLYVDDLVLLAPSWRTQRKLINVCLETVAHVGMTFNATKSTTMIFQPHKAARRVLRTFLSFKLRGVELTVVENFKYLGHIISSLMSDDNQDIARQMSLLYARANVIIRKFSKCSREVKLCLFRAHCTQFYGAEL